MWRKRGTMMAPEVELPPGFILPSVSLAPRTPQQELSADLYRFLLERLHEISPRERRSSSWMMSQEWDDEVRKIAAEAGAPPAVVAGSDYLLGLPVEIREDGGVPHLEPR